MQAFAHALPVALGAANAQHAPARMCAAAPKKRSAAKRLKRVMKSRARLLEHVPCAGDFPTAAECDAAVAALEMEVLAEKAVKGAEVVVVGAGKRMDMRNCIEVCTGKACMKNGAAGVVARAKGHAERSGAVVLESKCLKCCKEPGTTVRLAGTAVTCIKDIEAVDAIFMAASSPPRS